MKSSIAILLSVLVVGCSQQERVVEVPLPCPIVGPSGYEEITDMKSVSAQIADGRFEQKTVKSKAKGCEHVEASFYRINDKGLKESWKPPV